MDMTGHRTGDLIVISQSKERHPTTGEILYNVKCLCGNKILLRTSKLSSRKTCGQCKKEDRTGNFENEARYTAKKKDRGTFGKLPLDKQLLCIHDYCFATDIHGLADKYNITQMSCRDGIASFRERLNTMHELHYMERTSKTTVDPDLMKKALATDVVTKAIEPLLSKSDSEDLTLQEELYCYLYVYTGSNDIAIKESGFKETLPKDTATKRQLLGMFLRSKDNLKAYIQLLQDQRMDEIKTSKQVVQYELVQQVQQLKEAVAHRGTPSDRNSLLRAIELLGKTVGAFEDRVKITEVNASDALDELLEMTKAEIAKEIPYDPKAEHYEVASD